jgi:hypothetical protein
MDHEKSTGENSRLKKICQEKTKIFWGLLKFETVKQYRFKSGLIFPYFLNMKMISRVKAISCSMACIARYHQEFCVHFFEEFL